MECELCISLHPAFSEEDMDAMRHEEACADDAIAAHEDNAWADHAISEDQAAIQAAIDANLEPQPDPSHKRPRPAHYDQQPGHTVRMPAWPSDSCFTNTYDQQPGELQAACAGELGSPDFIWSRTLPPDRAAAIRRLALSTFLQQRLAPGDPARDWHTDLIEVAGGYVDGGLAGRAIVTHRRLLRLTRAGGWTLLNRLGIYSGAKHSAVAQAQIIDVFSHYNSPAVGREITALSPELRAAVEALLHVRGWSAPAWMQTNDEFGGLKKLDRFPNVALAVGKLTHLAGEGVCLLRLKEGKVYEAPAGWHWGSKAEVAAIMGPQQRNSMGEFTTTSLEEEFITTSVGGWDGNPHLPGIYQGVFVFTDSLEGGGFLDTVCMAHGGQGWIRETDVANLTSRTAHSWLLAGIVCVADWTDGDD